VNGNRVRLASRYRSTLLAGVLLLSACGGGGGDTSVGGSVTPPPVAITRAEAARFLKQASFGPDNAQLERVLQLGYPAWIDEQMAITPTSHLAGLAAYGTAPTQADRQEVWLRTAVTAPDQLRQRMAYALSQIMVISERSDLGGVPDAIASYNDLLLRDAFGNFRTLMEDVTLHPAMGRYLSMLGNRKPDAALNIRPDENYARELMQLFTIGLVELENDGRVKRDVAGAAIPTYDLDVVKGFAQVFTGWTFGGSPSWFQPSFDHRRPMQAFAEFHDTGSKRLLRGTVLPANQTAQKDLADALDNIFNHPNVAPFIARHLIQRFVTSNPTPAYVARVADRFNTNGAGVRGDLAATLRAVLLDAEARNPPADGTGKLQEPLLRLTSLWRAFDARAANGRYRLDYLGYVLGQAPFSSPSVFNFYKPDYAPPGEMRAAGLVAPELEIANESTVALTANVMAAYAFVLNSATAGLKPEDIYLDISTEIPHATDSNALINRVADKLQGGALSSELRAEAVAAIERIPASVAPGRVAEAIYSIVTSPEYASLR
jgi:uncharacterized protein (DUF1800 family)